MTEGLASILVYLSEDDQKSFVKERHVVGYNINWKRCITMTQNALQILEGHLVPLNDSTIY